MMIMRMAIRLDRARGIALAFIAPQGEDEHSPKALHLATCNARLPQGASELFKEFALKLAHLVATDFMRNEGAEEPLLGVIEVPAGGEEPTDAEVEGVVRRAINELSRQATESPVKDVIVTPDGKRKVIQ